MPLIREQLPATSRAPWLWASRHSPLLSATVNFPFGQSRHRRPPRPWRNDPSSTGPILVLGAAGQVGTQLIAQLAAQIGASRVVGAGRFPNAPAHLAGTPWLAMNLERMAHEPGSAAGLLAPIDAPAAVICAGAATNVDRCETETAWAMAVNADGPAALARATPRSVPFVYFSTEYVFDGGASKTATRGPYAENDSPRPISAYGRSKLRGEELILQVRADALIVRTTVVYGADPARKNFLYYLHRELSAGHTIQVVTDQISTPTANDDLARATLLLLNQGATGIYHVCGPELLSRYEFALRAARLLGLNEHLIEPITTSSLQQCAPRPLAGGLCTEKLRAALGNDVMRNMDTGVKAWAQRSLSPA